jgi:DNA mismatch endonuclease (patch repair protein)
VNVKSLPGKPDIVFTRARIAVFCDGDYWHGHNWAVRGLASLEDELARYSIYWRNKILGNIARDKESTERLEIDGWTVLRFWESNIKADAVKCADLIEQAYIERISR